MARKSTRANAKPQDDTGAPPPPAIPTPEISAEDDMVEPAEDEESTDEQAEPLIDDTDALDGDGPEANTETDYDGALNDDNQTDSHMVPASQMKIATEQAKGVETVRRSPSELPEPASQANARQKSSDDLKPNATPSSTAMDGSSRITHLLDTAKQTFNEANGFDESTLSSDTGVLKSMLAELIPKNKAIQFSHDEMERALSSALRQLNRFENLERDFEKAKASTENNWKRIDSGCTPTAEMYAYEIKISGTPLSHAIIRIIDLDNPSASALMKLENVSVIEQPVGFFNLKPLMRS